MLYHKMFDIIAFILVLILASFNCYTEPEAATKTVMSVQDVQDVQDDEYITITETYYDVPLEMNFQSYIIEECHKSNIDPELVLAIMSVESDFQSDIISKTDDYGIMQINIVNHEELEETLGIEDFLDPYQSAKAGIYLLGQYSWCEDETQMLMCYNMGISGAKKAWNSGIYETTYTKKVLKTKDEIGGTRNEIKILCNQNCEK